VAIAQVVDEVLRVPRRVVHDEARARGIETRHHGRDDEVDDLLPPSGRRRVLEVEDVVDDRPVEAGAEDRSADADRRERRVRDAVRALDLDVIVPPSPLPASQVRVDEAELGARVDVVTDDADGLHRQLLRL
jgi:hypothetical protein